MNTNEFTKAWLEMQTLEKLQATHRKGWRLGTYPAENILDYTKDEIEELRAEPDDIDEMADIMLCLMAYCTRKGWNPDDVGTAMQKKLRTRFPDAEKLLE
jgi:hypothetical protein